MRRFHLGVLTLALPVFAFTVFLMGCSTGRNKDQDDESGGTPVVQTSKPSSAGKERTPIKASEYVPITGVVKLVGEKPNVGALTKALQDGMKQDRDYCLSGSKLETSEQEYRIGDNNQVGNVFVWIEPEAGSYFEITPEQLKEVPKEKKIDQPHCAFVPHCTVMFTRYVSDGKGVLKPTGQKLLIENNAKVPHNTKSKGVRNPENNVTLGSGNKVDYDILPENVPFTLECSIHPWMKGYVRAYTHPYATLSVVGKDEADQAYGSYKIDKAPLGAKVRLFAWHEVGGYLTDPKGDPVEITKDMVKNFELKGK